MADIHLRRDRLHLSFLVIHQNMEMTTPPMVLGSVLPRHDSQALEPALRVRGELSSQAVLSVIIAPCPVGLPQVEDDAWEGFAGCG